MNAGINKTNDKQFSNMLHSWKSNLDLNDHNADTTITQTNTAMTNNRTLTENGLETNGELSEGRHFTKIHDRSTNTATAYKSSTFQPKKRKEHFTFDIVHENVSNNSTCQAEEESDNNPLNESFEISLQEESKTYDDHAKTVTSQTKEPEWHMVFSQMNDHGYAISEILSSTKDKYPSVIRKI